MTFGSGPARWPAAYGDARRWQRWSAAAYPVRVDGALMSVRYPPFRLDMGGADPGSTLSLGVTPEPCGIL